MSIKRILTVILMSVMLSGIFGISVQADEIANTTQGAITVTQPQGAQTEGAGATGSAGQNQPDKKAEETTKKTKTTTKKIKTTSKSAKSSKKSKAKKQAYTKSELRLMSAIIYCEAGIEPYAGKKAVGIVVMNRKKSKAFPNTIKEVIYQKGQFQPTRNGALKKALKAYDDGKFNSGVYKDCVKAAKAALNGDTKVTVKGKTINMKSYHFFSQHVKGCRLKIGGHQFK